MKLYFIVFLIVSFSCKTKKDQTSNPKHTLGNITSGYPKALWLNTSFEQAKKFIARSRRHLDETNIKLKGFNNWLLGVHSTLSKDFPEIKYAPQPKVFVIKDEDFNANVDYISTCLDLKILFKGEVGDVSSSARVIELDREYFSVRDQTSNCVVTQLEFIESSNVFLHFEKIRKKDHCYKIKETYLEADPQCLELNSYPKEIKRIIYPAASNYIVVNEPLFEKLTVEQLQSIITHELAHYYKLHNFHLPGEYFYFYQLDRWNNSEKKPVAVVDGIVKEIEDAILQHNEFYIRNQKIVGQEYHSAVFAFMVRYLSKINHKGFCNQFINEVLNNDILGEIIFDFPFYANWPEQSMDIYSFYEDSLLTCLKLPVDEQTIDLVNETLERLPFKFIERSELSQHNTLKSIADKITQVADSFIDKHNLKISQLFAKADENKIGYYTYEQEADEIALEISQKVGIPYEISISALFELLRNADEEGRLAPYPNVLDYNMCLEEKEKGFPNFIPIADYEMIHHSQCFRIYNIYREYKRHFENLSK